METTIFLPKTEIAMIILLGVICSYFLFLEVKVYNKDKLLKTLLITLGIICLVPIIICIIDLIKYIYQ